MKAVIIAAGDSSRLWPRTNKTPKTLLPFGNGSILSTIMSNLSVAGTTEFAIVLGFEADLIRNHLEENDYFGFKTTIVINQDYMKGNGLSVMTAERVVGSEDFILSMSDHVVTPIAVQRVVNSNESRNLLLVDKQIERIFDIDDATKVSCHNTRILSINKNLTEYNGIDCGIFRLNTRFFSAMRAKMEQGKDSISAGIEELIRNDDMLAVFMENHELWIDIDTPQAYQHALKMRF